VAKLAAHLVMVVGVADLTMKTKLLAVSKAIAKGDLTFVAPASPQLEMMGGEPVVYTTAGGRADGERGRSHTKLWWRKRPPSLFPESIGFWGGQQEKKEQLRPKVQ